MARSVYQYEQPRCPDNWNEAERRFYNRLIEALDDIYSKYGRLDEKMLSKSVVQRIDNSTATTLDKMVANILSAGKIATDSIEATFAHIVSLSAKYGSFDFETVKNLVADAMVLEAGQAGYVHITNLAATYAQAVNATIGNLVIQSSDGGYYQLDVSADGKVSAERVELTDGEIASGETGSGKVIVSTHITAETLGTATLAATQALINMIDASRINVDMLVAREEFVHTLTANEAFVVSLMANTAFVELLRTSKIVNNKSIEMIVGEVEDQERLSGIEVIEGAFVQADRREGEGIHVFGEFGPKQEGTPYPPGGGKNKFDVERASDIANWGKGSTWAYYELASTPGTYHFSYKPTISRVDNFILNVSRSTDSSSGDSLTLIYIDVSRTECTFELKEGEKLYFNCFFGYGFTQENLTTFVEGVLVEAQLELGTVTTPYEPYVGIFPVIGRNNLTFEHLGKNLFNMDSQTSGGITVSKNDDGAYVLNGTSTSLQMIRTPCSLPYGTYILSSSSLPIGVYVRIRKEDGSLLATNNQESVLEYRFNGKPGICEFTIQSGVSLDNVVIQSQLEYVSASTYAASPYEPYRCKNYTVEFSETVYGGKVDCYAGEVNSEWGVIESYAGEELPGEWLSNRDVYAEGATPTIGAQVVYKLETPVKISASPAWPAAFDGINTIYIDAESGYAEFGHDLPEVIDGAMEPASPATGAIWLDRSVTPAVLRRFNGSEWETLNDTTEIINAQNALQQQQQELKDKQAETDLYLKLDSANKVVRIGQKGVTSQYIIDAFGSGVSINDEIFSRFEANRAVFGDMEMRRPSSVGGLAFDSITQGGI